MASTWEDGDIAMKDEFLGSSLELDSDATDSNDTDDEIMFSSDTQFKYSDDSLIDPQMERQMAYLLDTITRVGGEVNRLRAEVDGLLEQNQGMRQSFDRLRGVIAEKGELNMDDFDLACDVVQATITDSGLSSKKIAN
jgi:hypothetical protein